MGLIRALVGGIGSTLADTYRDYFYCDALPTDVLMQKGKKKIGKKTEDTNIISNGSVIVVNEGQCMMIVDQGQVVELCAIPGEFTYDTSTEPSIFYGSLGTSIKETFKTMGKRIAFGGSTAHDQRVYYFNIREITDNKFGTSTPIPFRVSYADLGRSFTVGLRCNGVYSYILRDPLVFYKNICGNASSSYNRQQLDNTLYNEFMSHLQPALAKLTSSVRYDELPLNTEEITEAMKQVLEKEWKESRGIEIFKVAIKSVSIPKEDEDNIKKYEDMAWNANPLNAAAKMVEAQSSAMNTAAGNSGGNAMGFYGMNMAQAMGGMNTQNLFNMGLQQQANQQQADTWKCSCGSSNTGKFCANCGKEKPAPNGEWKCSCGTSNSGKFCANCGKPKPADDKWTCSCGTENGGKFCANCGKPKPTDDKWTCSCGTVNSGKFCADCGKPKL